MEVIHYSKMAGAPSVLKQAARLAGKPFASIPGPPLYPVVGNLPQYIFGPFDRLKYQHALESLHKEYGSLVKENLGGRTIIHVFDPEDIKTVYSHEGKYPEIPPLQETTQLYRAQKEMSLGIGNTNGEEWYRLRSNAHHRMLRPKEVAFHLPSVNKIAQDFSKRLEDLKLGEFGEVTDLRTEIGRWNLETSGMLLFDKRLGCLDFDSKGEEFARKMVEANGIVFKLAGILKLSFPFYRHITTPKWKQMVQHEDWMYAEAIRLVEEAITELKEELDNDSIYDRALSERFYFLNYLLSRQELSVKDVTVICLSVFLDGLSTTSPSLLFCLYCMANNPRAQEKVYAEILNVVGDNPNIPITTRHIARLPYLKAFIKETFRMWPNGTEVSRYTDKDMVLSGYEIPAGTHVDLNPMVHFRNPQVFVEPDQFIPERWIREQKETEDELKDRSPYDVVKSTDKMEEESITLNNVDEKEEKKALLEFEKHSLAASNAHPFLFTPFGHGTRMCAGRRFAEQQLVVVLATLVRRFNMSYPFGESMAQVYHTLLFPDRPVRVILSKRNRSS